MTYVLDASALVRFLDGKDGAERVKNIFADAANAECKVVISAVNWGEVTGVVAKRHGRALADGLHAELAPYGLEVVPVTAERAHRASYIKLELGIPFADCFAVELASASERVLVTADFDFKPAADSISVEFLPAISRL